MKCHRRFFGVVGWAVVALCASSVSHPALAAAETERIAAISGVHVPHQGFALSATVPSDRMCLELAQNLASELGIKVHVVCTDPSTGGTTIVAECGYADDRDASKVESFSRGWGATHDPYLICVPPDRDRFRAQRILPDLESLRPTPPTDLSKVPGHSLKK